MIDFNSIDDVAHYLLPPELEIDTDMLKAVEEQIVDQYVNFEDLGYDLLSQIDDEQIKIRVLENFVDYIDSRYINIIDIDSMPQNLNLLKFGQIIYKFLCVDCFNVFIPNFLEEQEIFSIDHFDLLVNLTFTKDINILKIKFTNIISNIIAKLEKLKNLDKNITKNEEFNTLLINYHFYIELIQSTDPEVFLYNYLRPILVKNLQSLLWRIT